MLMEITPLRLEHGMPLLAIKAEVAWDSSRGAIMQNPVRQSAPVPHAVGSATKGLDLVTIRQSCKEINIRYGNPVRINIRYGDGAHVDLTTPWTYYI